MRQSERLVPGQVEDSARGYVWVLDDWKRLDRFVLLGCEGGTYYASEEKISCANARAVAALIERDGARVVERVAELSRQGRAKKNDGAVFVLALAASIGDGATKQAVERHYGEVVRTGYHHLLFVDYVKDLRGWGRALRRIVGGWYLLQKPEELAYQLVKYQRRVGWTHRDVLRLAHPRTSDGVLSALLRWGARGEVSEDNVPPLVRAAQEAKTCDVSRLCSLIRQYDLPRECVPTEKLRYPSVWEALLERMPVTAMIRNLGVMARVGGLLAPASEATRRICEELGNVERLKRARVHPLQILAALLTYRGGGGVRGHNRWMPASSIVDALDRAFYLSFENVVPTNKRILMAIDVSESMWSDEVGDVPGLTPAVAAGAMALVTAASEKRCCFVVFSDEIRRLGVSSGQRVDEVCRQLQAIPWGVTDCAQPMLFASRQNIPVDAFVVLTDSETSAGAIHPVQALREYRRKSGIEARLVVVGMVANSFTIADPDDAGMLDVVGFSPDTPSVIADFIRDGA